MCTNNNTGGNQCNTIASPPVNVQFSADSNVGVHGKNRVHRYYSERDGTQIVQFG